MNASTRIYNAMQDLRSGRITVDECRAIFGTLRAQLGEQAFTLAKLAAVAHDSRA